MVYYIIIPSISNTMKIVTICYHLRIEFVFTYYNDKGNCFDRFLGNISIRILSKLVILSLFNNGNLTCTQQYTRIKLMLGKYFRQRKNKLIITIAYNSVQKLLLKTCNVSLFSVLCCIQKIRIRVLQIIVYHC